MKKLFTVLLALFVVATLVIACGKSEDKAAAKSEDNSGEKGFIGVSMPTQDLERWNFDGANIKAQLEKHGYKVNLQYAQNEVPAQIAQIENLITLGVKVLIIGAIDGQSLTTVLAQAAEKGIKVIAYDRLIMGTSNVDYYVSFDNYNVGVLEGRIIEKALGLDTGAKGPFNIEIFAGAPDDNNADFFYKGGISVIKPYIDKGIVKVPSNQYGWPKYGTEAWSTQKAQERMSTLLSTYYTGDTKLDAVLSPNDSVAYGIITALKSVGYAPGDATRPMPAIDGQDCDRVNVKAIWDGEQTASVYKDTRTLAERTVIMTEAILNGTNPEVNNVTDYNNGVKVVPSYLCEPIIVYKDMIKSILIDSKYYTADEVKIPELK